MDIDMFFSTIGLLFLISFISSWREKDAIITMLNNHLFSDGKLVVSKKWMKKHLGIKKQLMPQYLYYKTYLVVIYALLGPVNTLIFLCFGCKKEVGGILILIHCCLGILDTVVLYIVSTMYKTRHKNK